MDENEKKKEEISVHESSAGGLLIKNINSIDSSGDISASLSLAKLPQKRFFRQRAHANPFSDHLLE